MYIRSAHIQNIRSISDFEMKFEEGHEAGWHVVIGENGSGKTTLLRALALGLMGERDHLAIPIEPPMASMLRMTAKLGGVDVVFSLDRENDQLARQSVVREEISGKLVLMLDYHGERKINFNSEKEGMPKKVILHRKDETSSHLDWKANSPENNWGARLSVPPNEKTTGVEIHMALGGIIFDNIGAGFFAAGFGSSRRFRGGSSIWDKINGNRPRLSAMKALFSDEISFSEVENWLDHLYKESFEGKNQNLLWVTTFLNGKPGEANHLLPDGVQLSKVSSEGVFFTDANGATISLHDLSDGYRSVLSLTMELIRQLIRSYGDEKVFADIKQGRMVINLPGVVLIDEADAHLHPSWQTKIGQWFTTYFPKLQFIVTTHSPLICRACADTGKIFRLAAPGSGNASKELVGLDRDKLVYGNILDAIGTNAFGTGIGQGDKAVQMLERLAKLTNSGLVKPLTTKEQEELDHLKQIFTTDDTFAF